MKEWKMWVIWLKIFCISSWGPPCPQPCRYKTGYIFYLQCSFDADFPSLNVQFTKCVHHLYNWQCSELNHIMDCNGLFPLKSHGKMIIILTQRTQRMRFRREWVCWMYCKNVPDCRRRQRMANSWWELIMTDNETVNKQCLHFSVGQHFERRVTPSRAQTTREHFHLHV